MRKKNGRSFKEFEVKLGKIGLRPRLELHARTHNVSLQDVYEGDRAASIVAARRTIYRWLVKNGMSLNEAARLFDRAPSGVWKLVRL